MEDDCKKKFVIVPDTSLTKGDKGDKGDPGSDATIILPLSSDDVDYNGIDLTTVLNGLLYVPLQILTFNSLNTIFEQGVVLTSIQLTWTYNKVVQAQGITGPGVVPPSLIPSDRTKLVTLSSIGSNITITLTSDDNVSDTTPAITRTLDIVFTQKIYYGKAVIGTINSAFILAFTNELALTRIKDFTANTGALEYIWFACPVAYGVPDFKTNGFDGGFLLAATIAFTNASGFTENYNVYRSVNENLGITDINVL